MISVLVNAHPFDATITSWLQIIFQASEKSVLDFAFKGFPITILKQGMPVVGL